MKCPYCEEELRLDNTCINPTCPYFGATVTVNFPNKNNIDNNENNINDLNNDEPSNFNLNKAATTYSNIYSGNDISGEEFATFIGNKNTNFYLKRFKKLDNDHKFLSWNWPCFFLGAYWLLYRKIYIPAAILIFLTLSSSRLFESKTHLLLTLVIRIILTLFANYIYFNHSKRKIKSIRKNILNLSASQYVNRLRVKGGVTLTAPLILLIIYIIVAIISVAMWLTVISTPHNFSSPSYYF